MAFRKENTDFVKEDTVLKYMKYFSLLQLLFGVDYKYFSSPIKWIAKAYCVVVQFVIVVIYVCHRQNVVFLLFHVFKIIEHILIVLISIFDKKSGNWKSVCLLMKDIDGKLRITDEQNSKMLNNACITFILVICIRICHVTVLCFDKLNTCTTEWSKTLGSIFLLMSLEVMQISRSIHFGLIWFRMKCLRANLEKKFVKKNVLLVNRRSIVIETTSVSAYLDVYKNIMNAADDVERTYTTQIFLGLACGFPNILINLYLILVYLNQKMVLRTISATVEGLQQLLIPCFPAIAAECVSAEVDKIKLSLLHKFIDSYGNISQDNEEITDFLDYINVRPYQFRIWRIFKMDAGLILRFASLCTTYLIVIIQFTHLY